MNKKIILTSIIAMCMTYPTYADIAKNNNDPSCDQSTIGATTGATDLEAEWDPNTINMEWYSDGAKITPDNPAANTCTYDGNVTLPTNTLSKTGYTFLGWAVVPKFDLSTLASELNTNGSRSVYITFNSSNSNKYYDFDESDRNVWGVEFSYGTLKGKAICSTQPGSNGWYTNGVHDDNGDWSNTTRLITLTDETGQEGSGYCWCQPTGFRGTNANTFMAVASPAWVFRNNYTYANSCAENCASACAYRVRIDSDFRGAVFGISQ